MILESYITYEDYLDLGGICSELEFPRLASRACHWIDQITFNRIPKLPEIPTSVLEVLTEYINNMYSYNTENKTASQVEKYSNGVETISYRKTSLSEVNKTCVKFAQAWLPDYLICRSVNFDVTKYLQPENNDTEQTETD